MVRSTPDRLEGEHTIMPQLWWPVPAISFTTTLDIGPSKCEADATNSAKSDELSQMGVAFHDVAGLARQGERGCHRSAA